MYEKLPLILKHLEKFNVILIALVNLKNIISMFYTKKW